MADVALVKSLYFPKRCIKFFGRLKNQFIDRGFSQTVATAVLKDPSVVSLSQRLTAQLAGYDVSKSQKDFQVSGAIYSGIEDISDNTSGVALVLSANRVVFDGGVIDARIMSQRYAVEAARQRLYACRRACSGTSVDVG